jgi:hypothetical protein
MDPASGSFGRSAAIGLSAASLIFLAACASGGPAPGAHGASPTLAPRQALRAAELEADRVSSFVETTSAQGRGASPTTMTATMRCQLRPTLKVSGDMHTDLAGVSTEMKTIATDDAVYINVGPISGFPSVRGKPGKPWIKFGLNALKAGASGVAQLAQLGQVTQSVDVGVHLRISQLATNVRVAGTQTIDGVPTTEYAGSYRADEILKALPARERAKFAPLLKMMGSGPVHFREWIDGQHRLRKLVEVSTSNGTTTTGTETYTAYNRPVHITVPPASQTDTVFGF